jgi:hypothetical protein
MSIEGMVWSVNVKVSFVQRAMKLRKGRWKLNPFLRTTDGRGWTQRGRAAGTDRGCPQPQRHRPFERVRTCPSRLSIRTCCGSGDPRSASVAASPRCTTMVKLRAFPTGSSTGTGPRLSPAAAAPPVRARADLPKLSFHSRLLRVGRPALRFGRDFAALCPSVFIRGCFRFLTVFQRRNSVADS